MTSAKNCKVQVRFDEVSIDNLRLAKVHSVKCLSSFERSILIAIHTLFSFAQPLSVWASAMQDKKSLKRSSPKRTNSQVLLSSSDEAVYLSNYASLFCSSPIDRELSESTIISERSYEQYLFLRLQELISCCSPRCRTCSCLYSNWKPIGITKVRSTKFPEVNSSTFIQFRRE